MRFSELDGRRVGLWGLGRETRSLARQLAVRLPGARIVAVIGEETVPGARLVAPADAAAAEIDVLVRSPGVSIHRPEVRAVAARVPVVTATGLWLAERGGRRVIGVTGTKGKSTTATMVAHLLGAAGVPAHLAGNIGRPALDLLDAPPDDWAVVELSSYQIADLPVGPQVALVTNLFKEHVDWHGDEATYRREKLRLLGLPGVEARVLPAGRAVAGAEARRFGAPDAWHAAADGVREGGALRVALADLPLRGRHNAENLAAALAALDAAGLPRPPLPAAVRGIAALPHRLQTVSTAGGIEWVDDSISTTPESAAAALDAYAGRPLVLIAGGLDRDQEYGALGTAVARRDAALIGLPTTGGRLLAAARAAGLAPERTVAAADMDAAVAAARRFAAPGTVGLLSPAAPSYHANRSFEERGAHFAALAATATM
ncbi:MAG TPA: UDP-N-acetylmuramoyl-L-alanine--D-glutamate ligase [Solirubrobacteraceae bacterium]